MHNDVVDFVEQSAYKSNVEPTAFMRQNVVAQRNYVWVRPPAEAGEQSSIRDRLLRNDMNDDHQVNVAKPPSSPDPRVRAIPRQGALRPLENWDLRKFHRLLTRI